MDSNKIIDSNKLSLVCPNGTLSFDRSELESNQFIKNTIIHKIFFPNREQIFAPSTEIKLMWDINIVAQLLSFIRQGIIYTFYTEKNNIRRLELAHLIEYLSGENNLWFHCAQCLRNGVMDLFERIYTESCSNRL